MIVLAPLPISYLEPAKSLWFPHVMAIAERHRLDVDAMCGMMMRGEVGVFLVWDGDTKKVKAFIGVHYMVRGNNERVGEIWWLTGEDRKAWVHLFADLITHLKEQEGCVSIKATARKGWKPHLEANGFRLTHMVFEKDI